MTVFDALDESWLIVSSMSAAIGRATKIANTHAGATPRYTRHSDAPSPWRTAWSVATSSATINSAGERLTRTSNSGAAERITVEGSLAEVSTAPADERNHPTLLRIQFVRVLKKPPTTVEVTTCVTQLKGRTMHQR